MIDTMDTIDDTQIEMSDTPIDMPPLDYQMPDGSSPVKAEHHQLPPELKAAQEFERQQALERQRAQNPESDDSEEQPTVNSSKSKEENLRILREMNAQTMRERDMLARKLQEYEAQQAPKAEPIEEDITINESELVEGKHLARAMKRIKQLEVQQKQYMQQNNAVTAEMKLRAQYPDFDKVMTLENIQMLSAGYPELAKSLNATNDLFDKASSTYTIIKKFGIYSDQPYQAEKKKAIANAVKPRPSNSVSPQRGDSPINRANMFADGLTEELKEKLLHEMNECSKLY